jgi:hypothetical protein
LGYGKTIGSAGDTALVEQSVKNHKQVKIDSPDILHPNITNWFLQLELYHSLRHAQSWIIQRREVPYDSAASLLGPTNASRLDGDNRTAPSSLFGASQKAAGACGIKIG